MPKLSSFTIRFHEHVHVRRDEGGFKFPNADSNDAMRLGGELYGTACFKDPNCHTNVPDTARESRTD
jgi:hypothetical protein